MKERAISAVEDELTLTYRVDREESVRDRSGPVCVVCQCVCCVPVCVLCASVCVCQCVCVCAIYTVYK